MSSEKSNGVSSPYDSLKNVLHQLTALAAKPELQNAASMFDEIDHQKRQIKAKEEDLAKGQSQNQAAIEAIMGVNEKLKIEQKSIETEKSSLQNNLRKKEKGLEECSQQIKSLRAQLAKLQSDHSKEVAKVAQSCRDITSLHETLKRKDTEVDKMLSDKANLKTTLFTEQKKIENFKNDLISLREEERKSSGKLKKLEGFTVGYTEVDEELMLDEFAKLWDYATGELSAILNQDLDDKALNDKLFWDRFRKDSSNAVPLLASNSPSAKGMRLVVILATLAREIDQHIFQPNYLSEESNLRAIFCKLAATDHEKEAFCRSLLLSIDSTAQQESLELRIQAIVRKVSQFLLHALSEPQYGEMHQRIENVVRRAVQVWRPIQTSQKRFEPDFEPLEWDDDEWCLFRFPGEVPGEDQEQHEHYQDIRDDILLTVFPRISLVEDNKRYPQTFVTHLMKSQKLCVAAEQETPREATSPKIGRMSANGARRKSIAQSSPRSNGGSFFGASGV